MSGECKFCGAGGHQNGAKWTWNCGTVADSWGMRRSQQCRDGEQAKLSEKRERDSRDASDLARFRTIFPSIMPDDSREISAEICEALGMQNLGFDCTGTRRWFQIDGGVVSVAIRSDTTTGVYGEVTHGWCKTAGQLACLIAARRNVESKGD